MTNKNALKTMKQCTDLLLEVRKCTKVLTGARISFTDPSCEEKFDKFRECVVSSFIPREDFTRANKAVGELVNLLEEVVRGLGGRGWLLPRETNDFVKNPLEHVKKKILLYTYDLLRRKINLGEYASKSRSAVNTSMRSNMRTVYEIWVLASILKHTSTQHARIIYPEHGFIHFDRYGKQKTGTMPPNVVIEIPGRGLLSFYLEAPRPLGWRDFKDLKQVWRFYTSLRPDIMIYPGLVLDIVDYESPDIPIIKPEVVVECKELEDWYVKTRELKGPVNPSLSFDEWFKRWLTGLWTGLADVLGVDSDVVREISRGEKKGIRIRETQLIKLYKSIYKPRYFYLVSSPRLPGYVKRDLEEDGVVVFDNAEIGCPGCLGELAEEVSKLAKPIESRAGGEIDILRRELARRGLLLSEVEILKLALKFALRKIDEFAESTALGI